MISRTVRRLLLAPAEGLLTQMPRALVVSIVAMVIDVVILALLVQFAGVSAIPAAVIGYLTGGVVQYVLCSVWVFPNAPKSAATGFVAFTVLSLGGLAITAGTIQFLHETYALPLTFAKVVALGLAFNWNFFTRKYLLFRPDAASEPATQ